MPGAGVRLIGVTIGRRPDTDKYLLRTGWGMPWTHGTPARRDTAARWSATTRLDIYPAIPWTAGTPLYASLTAPWEQQPRHNRRVAMPWAHFSNVVASDHRLAWRTLTQRRIRPALAWDQFTATHRPRTSVPWLMPHIRRARAAIPWNHFQRTGRDYRVAWNTPSLVRDGWIFPWGQGGGIPWLVIPPAPEEPPPATPPPIYTPPAGAYVGLNLGCPLIDLPGDFIGLTFGPFACYGARQQRRIIVVLNSVSVHRLPDHLPIDATAVELTTNVDTWAWSCRIALGSRADLDALKPISSGQRRVEISINGYIWQVLIEGFDDDRVFARYGASVRGRSETVRLAAPYALTRSKDVVNDRLAEQLINEELTNTGFIADYQAIDWLVPAGAFNYQELTPIQAISQVVRASGSVLQSHAKDEQLIIQPRYPVSPWDWLATAPGATIADDHITALRAQALSRPLYDSVFVAGELQGVSAQIKRTGSAAETNAPSVVDPLMTHADAARERGRNILSDRGDQALVSLDVPLFATPLLSGQPGLVLPLTLVDVAEGLESWRGLTTGVNIRTQRADKQLTVEQTIEIERHMSDAN